MLIFDSHPKVFAIETVTFRGALDEDPITTTAFTHNDLYILCILRILRLSTACLESS